ncbi:MAG: hypothetical protein ACRDTX_30660, partial [Pseudonocardiaceae bacterium]
GWGYAQRWCSRWWHDDGWGYVAWWRHDDGWGYAQRWIRDTPSGHRPGPTAISRVDKANCSHGAARSAGACRELDTTDILAEREVGSVEFTTR